jgi:hypothetical protein
LSKEPLPASFDKLGMLAPEDLDIDNRIVESGALALVAAPGGH